MEKTALFFSNIEALSSFLNTSTALNLFILPKLKIVSAVFSEEELRRALAQYGATIVSLSQLLHPEKGKETVNNFSFNRKKFQWNQFWRRRRHQQTALAH